MERSVVVRINPEQEGCRHWREECPPPMGQVPAPLARPPRSQHAAILVREAKGPKDKGPKHRFAILRRIDGCSFQDGVCCGGDGRLSQFQIDGDSVRNGQGRYLEKYLERTGVERYREVSVYTGVYQDGREARTRTRGYISRE
jgi:hypothetical protein